MDNRIKEIRTNKSITQLALAKLSGVSLAMIQALEQGNRNLTSGSLDQAIRISDVLGVSILELVDWQGYELMTAELEDKHVESKEEITHK